QPFEREFCVLAEHRMSKVSKKLRIGIIYGCNDADQVSCRRGTVNQLTRQKASRIESRVITGRPYCKRICAYERHGIAEIWPLGYNTARFEFVDQLRNYRFQTFNPRKRQGQRRVCWLFLPGVAQNQCLGQSENEFF